MTLKSRLRVTQGYWKWHSSKDRLRFPIRLDAYRAILYRLRDIATYWLKIATFYTPPVMFSAHGHEGGDPVRISPICMILIKLEWLGYRVHGEETDNTCMLIRFHRIRERNGRTDRRGRNCYVNIGRHCADARCLVLSYGRKKEGVTAMVVSFGGWYSNF